LSRARQFLEEYDDHDYYEPCEWIGVDLDGTLAFKNEDWEDERVGKPIPLMLERVKEWLAQGREVRIFTARVAPPHTPERMETHRRSVEQWCLEYLGEILPITATKDHYMGVLWDDRCVTVEHNTGKCLTVGEVGL